MATNSVSGAKQERPGKGGRYHHAGLRDVLIAETLALVAAGSLESLSLRDVARRAGVSHAAVYRHFPDRAGLIASVATVGMWGLAAALEKVERETESRAPVERIAALGEEYVGFATREPGQFRAMFARDIARKGPYPELRAASDAAASTLSRLVDAAVAAGAIQAADAKEVSLAVWALLHGVATLAADDQLAEGELSIPPGSSVTLTSIVSGGVTRLLAGFGLPPTRGGRE